ncbi:hypothetical protein [Urechidicola vernalis]|uniref:Alpha-L-rhamnosidase six-hairpin glycosidase domain-containing protein n=1 Tax=Urechidicola vernalis TaxID=3075600 RepID=A0ABU2Y2X0_9FLAO|nr:hypothetical protein [Urechidicola sp. P050]MDT0552135.1 hypothetical protein [Urechidicola sp. P050]
MLASIYRKGLLIVFLIVSMAVYTQDSKDFELTLKSSNKDLEVVFNWAKEKAAFYVQTGKTGPIEVWENGEATDTVAYIPSYWAGYPGRTAYYSRDFCHQIEGAYFLGLHDENFSMLKTFAASANAKQKWFPAWALNFDGSIYKLDFKTVDNFVREVPATFELVEKAYQLYLWTRDTRYLNDPILWNYYTKSVTDFITIHDKKLPNGVAEGTGKGIFAGAASFNEQRDLPLIEAGDAIASQYQAFVAYAEMAKLRGELQLYQEFIKKAEELKFYFNTDWGVKNSKSYNRGYLVDGTNADGWGKENSWFMPMKEITDANSPRTKEYLAYINERLESKDDIPENIEALSYIPELYFKHHQNELGYKWMLHIMNNLKQEHTYQKATGRNGDYPEVSYVLIRNLIVDMLGITPLPQQNTITTLSHLPKSVNNLGVSNLSLGNSVVNISHIGQKKSTIKHLSGLNPLTCEVQFYGNHKVLMVNDKTVNTKQRVHNGKALSLVEITLKPSETVIVSVPTK